MIIQGDARALPLRDGCVQTVVTSPPYWGLRDYGTSNQIGLEPTPDAYVANVVKVFAEVWRVLRDDGTVWLNLGDSYVANGSNQVPQTKQHVGSGFAGPNRDGATGLAPKNLVGIPWRVAFALQAEGWYLRQDIIWHKPNPMPESVTDRCTKAHEYIFLLSKREKYYFDSTAMQEDGVYPAGTMAAKGSVTRTKTPFVNGRPPEYKEYDGKRNKRSVWTVTTQPYAEAHFATFPEALIEPCIMAGAPAGGLVLDPFIGSGTTGVVCERLSRRWVGVDLTYQHLSAKRTAQRGLQFATASA